MQSITINVPNNELLDKLTWFLEHFKEEGLEIVPKEDLDDLKLLQTTRGEDSISFLHAKAPALKEEGFVGMWKNRQDMEDSALWVQELRKKEWGD